jgi:hypothetical protein
MGYSLLLGRFFYKASKDARISIAHIGLFATLLECWKEEDLNNPVLISAPMIMPKAKISSTATYHRLIRQLHEYGYICYDAGYYKGLGSRVQLNKD